MSESTLRIARLTVRDGLHQLEAGRADLARRQFEAVERMLTREIEALTKQNRSEAA